MVEIEEENVEVVELKGLVTQVGDRDDLECIWCKGLSTLESTSTFLAAAFG